MDEIFEGLVRSEALEFFLDEHHKKESCSEIVEVEEPMSSLNSMSSNRQQNVVR